MDRGLAVLLVAMLGCGGEPAAAKEAAPPVVARDAAPAAGADAAAGAAAACPACPLCEPEPGTPHDVLTLTRVAFADLPGWADDKHAEAVLVVPALVRGDREARR